MKSCELQMQYPSNLASVSERLKSFSGVFQLFVSGVGRLAA